MLCTLNEKAPICIFFFVLLIGLTACENRNPVADESLIRQQTFDRDRDQWVQDISKFIADAEALIQETSLLK